jgi:hypothetical protein
MLQQGPLASVSINYGTDVSSYLTLLAIMLLYWTISPIILLLAAMQFAAAYMALKYQYLCVFKRNYESNGQFFFLFYKHTMRSLLFSSCIFIAFMVIKRGILQTYALTPLPVVITCAWVFTVRRFKEQSRFVVGSSAVGIASENQIADFAINKARSCGQNKEGMPTLEIDDNVKPFDESDLDETNSVSYLQRSKYVELKSGNCGNTTHNHEESRISTTIFTPDLFKPPEMSAALHAEPYPYRLQSRRLIDCNGRLDALYYSDDYVSSNDPPYQEPTLMDEKNSQPIRRKDSAWKGILFYIASVFLPKWKN